VTDTPPARYPYLVFAGCAGIAVAAIVYRFVMLPLGWDPPGQFVLYGLPPGLVIASWQLVKPIRERRWPVLLALGTAVAAGAAAFGLLYVLIPTYGRTALTTRDLPGFSIDLPPGKIHDESADYSLGKVEITGVAGTGAVSGVSWEPGGALSDDDLALTAKGLANAFGGKVDELMTIGSYRSFALDSPKGKIYATVATCGGRRIVVIDGGEDGALQLHRRIVDSIACHPDAAREAAVVTTPLTIDLPPSWHEVASQPDVVQLSDDKAILFVRSLQGRPDPKGTETVLTAVLKALGAEVTLHGRTGDVIQIDGTMEGTKFAGWAMTVECPPNTGLVLALAETREAADALAELVRSKKRCLKPGEKPTWGT
jgi:hypothetical protein